MAGNYSAAYGAAGRQLTVLRDNGIPSVTVTPTVSIGGAPQAYDGGYTNNQVTYALSSVSVVPF